MKLGEKTHRHRSGTSASSCSQRVHVRAGGCKDNDNGTYGDDARGV